MRIAGIGFAVLAAALAWAAPGWAAPPDCDVPGYLLLSDYTLEHVSMAVRDHHRLTIVVLGSASSQLAGADGAANSYPVRLEEALKRRLKDVEVKVTARAKARQTAADMARGLEAVLTGDRPDLIIWQTGTVDAIRGVDPDRFREVLENGLSRIQAAGVDAILMNMQYSPRTETVLALGTYRDNMRWVSQERGAPLFDRLGIMRYWSDTAVFDFDRATKAAGMARQVHACIGRALATMVIEAAHLQNH